MPYTLPPLAYATDALVPHVDAKTMEIHHGKHHQAYITNANKALEGTKWAEVPAEELITKLAELPDTIRGPLRNNAGGHVNHSMFWASMAPPGTGGGGEPTGPLAEAINKAFGTFAHFKEEFEKAGLARFGSGWVWLCAKAGGVTICTTANQDNPLMGEAIAGCGGTPILGNDVWEHSYYLNYQNRRADYLKAWWNVVNWAKVGERFAGVK